ncbi:MAG: proteasome-type protease [Hyphomicrobiaceae bacterium]|nr:proteasome-type protease [Hyphomicrobiaceae bacterium]MCC0025232.1 proteasome-type protease [Hyphomicrobiaceae bacterium]
MTYCVALKLAHGLVFASDTRTNAGVDNVSVFRKMHTFSVPGERLITILTAGNLATTQLTISELEDRSRAADDRNPSLLETVSMFQTAQVVGDMLKAVIARNDDTGQKADSKFNATLIVGGQIKGQPPRLFMIYPEGNFIEASEDTPYFQIGETKYGRPILVRAFDAEMSFEAAVKLLLVSFDSTIKANLSVGPPIDVQYYANDSLKRGYETRIKADDPYFLKISTGWGEALREAFQHLPDFNSD